MLLRLKYLKTERVAQLLGSNLKVHFAGSEQIDFSMTASKAGAKYFLFTVFPFINRQFGLKGYPITCKTLFPPAEIAKFSKHTIMDSGLFTLMFGACKGMEIKKDFLMQYTDALINFVKENNITATCVEIDCQKVLGVDEAWEFRQYMRDNMKNKIINVYHVEDGQKGLDRLIEFSDYIAISVPELRIAMPKVYKENTHRIAHYIKSKKPEIDIHLLGCTEMGMLKRNNFCTSSDSTSWQAVNRYGNILGRHVKAIKPEIKQQAKEAVAEVMAACGIEPTEKRFDYYSNYYISAMLHKMEYTKAAGNQD